MAILYELAKRAYAHPETTAIVKRAVSGHHDGVEGVELPTWGFVLLYVSILVSGLAISLVSYMLEGVIMTLCMVESPVAAITVSPSTHEAGDKEEKEGLLEAGPTITLVNQKPITSSIRATIKHLVAHAGRYSRFRGIKLHILHGISFAFVAEFLGGALPYVPGKSILVAALAGAAVANIHAAWTHKVVGMPTTKSFWQRIPAKSNWKKLAFPAALKAAMPYLSMYITIGFGMLLGLHRAGRDNFNDYKCAQWTSLIVRFVAVFVFSLLITLFLYVPAIVTLVRIEASILPEDQDTIVPFDRSFGGKVVSGVVGFLDAWRSFNWEARRRLIKLYIKSFFIIMGLILVVTHVIAFEMFAIMGPALGKFLAQAKNEGRL